MKRAGHLDGIPMIGGDLSMAQAWKSAFCSLVASGETSDDPRFPVVENAVHQGMNCVNNSSMGRLFDSASAILHLKEENRYKGECAMALERAAEEALMEGRKPLPLHLTLDDHDGQLIWDRADLIHGLVATDGKIKEGALGFHRAIVEMVVKSAELLGVEQVILTGGCFHNSILWNETQNALEKKHFKVYGNEKVPCGDGGISLGQAWYGLLKG